MADLYGIGAAAVGGGIGMIQSAWNNNMAAERERIARLENFRYGEAAANNADARTRRLYQDFYSPEALLRQYTDAGLSPSLMFGGTPGQGGTSGAQGTGAAGVSPNVFGVDLLKGVEAANIMAQTRKINAEADVIEGKNDRGELELEQLRENVKNVIENTKNVNLRNEFQLLENEYQTYINAITADTGWDTAKANLDVLIKSAEKLAGEVKSAHAKGEVDEASIKTMIEYNKAALQNVLADTLEKKANIKLSKAQVASLIGHLGIDIKQVKLNEKEVEQRVKKWSIENKLAERQANILISHEVLGYITGFANSTANVVRAFNGN